MFKKNIFKLKYIMRGRGFRFGNTPMNPMVLGVILLVVCVLGFVVYKMMHKTDQFTTDTLASKLSGKSAEQAAAQKAASDAAQKAQDAAKAQASTKKTTTSNKYILQKTDGLIYTGSSFTNVTKQFTTADYLRKVFKLNDGTFGGIGGDGNIYTTSPGQTLSQSATFTKQTSSGDFTQAIQMKDGTFTALKDSTIYTAPILAGKWTPRNHQYGSIQIFQLPNGDVGRIDINDKSVHINKGRSTFSYTLSTEIIPNPGVQVQWVAIIPINLSYNVGPILNNIYSVGIDNNIYSTPTLYGATWSPVTSTRDALYIS